MNTSTKSSYSFVKDGANEITMAENKVVTTNIKSEIASKLNNNVLFMAKKVTDVMTGIGDAKTKIKSIILIGNPGVGKSTICNMLGANFEAETDFVSGLTQDVQRIEVEIGNQKMEIIDTPGIKEFDNNKTKQNVDKLMYVLKSGREMSLSFVMTLQGGRVNAIDLLLLQQIVYAFNVPPDQIIVIINKMDKKEMQLKQNEEKFAKLKSYISGSCNNIPFAIVCFPKFIEGQSAQYDEMTSKIRILVFIFMLQHYVKYIT